MAVLKCKMCGGTLEVIEGTTVAVCEYCGTKQTLPKTTDDVTANLFNRANNLRLKCEFDKAADVYEKIVQNDDGEAEAHWGLVLCKYGIEYVEDPATGKRIPTCHRTLFDAITTDVDYLAAIDYSDPAQQTIYEQEARAIDKIQKNILAIAQNERPFDVFICYKETDESGKRTVDSTIANDIYYQLTTEGFKVFFAAITLEDKLGQEYEPYIFAALNSAKVMLVLGTKPEFFSAVWVKNEWSRFLKLMKTDRSKVLIPCFRDMDAYDLPEEFAHLQAQDMSKIGFINDVIRGIKKLVNKEETAKPVAAVSEVKTAPAGDTAPLLRRATIFLEDGDFTDADEYAEKVLDINPECAEAYLYKLMAELRIKTQSDLVNLDLPFDGNNNCVKAYRFGDAALRKFLDDTNAFIKNRNEAALKDELYDEAVTLISKDTAQNYAAAIELLKKLDGWKDAVERIEFCKQKFLELAERENEGRYQLAISAMNADRIPSYNTAIRILENIADYKNAKEMIHECEERIKRLEAEKQAIKAERSRLEREAEEKKRKKNKVISISVLSVIAAVVAFIILLNSVIIPETKYQTAMGYIDDEDYVSAYEALIELGDYKDSDEVAAELFRDMLVESDVGEYLIFGSYNDKAIEWLVLEKTDDRLLVISKEAIERRAYNDEFESVTWETCTLRSWLNDEFYNSAFSKAERKLIPTVTVTADPNYYDTDPGNDTEDQVFLLSIEEANEYFASNSDRVCYDEAGSSRLWWLRSPGYYQYDAAIVDNDGIVLELGIFVNRDSYAVRPALWIDINSLLFES